MCNQPFSTAQQKPFKELLNTLNPDAKIVSDKTIRADLLKEYEKKFNDLKHEIIEIPGKISITLDGWTSKNFLAFVAIRGHWLDKDWNYQSKLFDFAYVEGDHSGLNHSRILTDCLIRLGIPYSKILAITLDNATSNDTIFHWLEEISAESCHIRCMAHIINLAVQDILQILKVPHEDNIEDDINLDDEVGFHYKKYTYFFNIIRLFLCPDCRF